MFEIVAILGKNNRKSCHPRQIFKRSVQYPNGAARPGGVTQGSTPPTPPPIARANTCKGLDAQRGRAAIRTSKYGDARGRSSLPLPPPDPPVPVLSDRVAADAALSVACAWRVARAVGSMPAASRPSRQPHDITVTQRNSRWFFKIESGSRVDIDTISARARGDSTSGSLRW